jgi:hypothetical protein
MTVEEINGLRTTKVRLKLFAAVRVPGRIYREINGDVYDSVTGYIVTARVKEQIDHQWIEAVPRVRGRLVAGSRLLPACRQRVRRGTDREDGRMSGLGAIGGDDE